MKLLIYDTETTGLPKDYKAHVHDLDNWPRLVQLAWIVTDNDGKTLTYRNHIIKTSVPIPTAASDIHGITDEISQSQGIDIIRALVEFRVAAQICDVHAGHNVNFDRKIVGAEFIRYGMEEAYEHMKTSTRICTMIKSTKAVGLRNPGNNRPKWPKLQELYFFLFGENFEDAHDAMADVSATAKCLFELFNRGIIDDPEFK